MKKGKKRKTKEQEITEVLIDLEEDLSNFKLNNDRKNKTIKEYIRLLILAKKEYQKLSEENKRLKETSERNKRQTKNSREEKKYKRRQYVIEETDSEQSGEKELLSEVEEITEDIPAEITEKRKKITETKGEKKLKNLKRKKQEKFSNI